MSDRSVPPDRLVVLGGMGDLATRHLLPALVHMHSHGLLAADFQIVAVDRARIAAGAYRENVDRALALHASSRTPSERRSIVRRLDYVAADLMEGPDLTDVLGASPAVVYLSLPPQAYHAAVVALRGGRLHEDSRVVVEKPFGHDRRSARELNELLHSLVPETGIYRADHFLYHQMIQDIVAVRSASAGLGELFDSAHVEAVELVWEEQTGVAGRVDFFESNGALRDMVQSHLLQTLAIVAMEPLQTLDEKAFRDSRADLLRHVRTPTAADVDAHTVRGRYATGSIDGSQVRGYVDEEGVDPRRGTETYVGLRVEVDTPRWRGVPFIVRTGKRLGSPTRNVCLRLRANRTGITGSGRVPSGLRFTPGGVALDIAVSAPAGLPNVVGAELSLPRPARALPPSALLMRDVLAGDPTFCVREDEVDECWRIVDPVVARWATGNPPLVDYAAGSPGPTERPRTGHQGRR